MGYTHAIVLRCFATILCGILFLQSQDAGQSPVSPLSPADQRIADQIGQSISNTEWLGVLAPVAISPFFGITCLAGMSQFGGELLGTNSFVSSNPVLNNPTVFWIFLGLTLLTSLPRLTKVSKPIAQATDQIETYSGIITLLVIRFATPQVDAAADEVVMQMGVLSFTGDILLGAAAAINIVVINSVKFFFEILVWLTPVPLIDAALELINKFLCASLLAIYAFSPLVATALNLLLFVVCLLCFAWIHRQVVYMRTMLCDPIIAFIRPAYSLPKKDELALFPVADFQAAPARARLLLSKSESGWKLVQRRWLFGTRTFDIPNENQLQIRRGMLHNTLTIEGPNAGDFSFSRRYGANLGSLADKLGCNLVEVEPGILDISDA